MWVAVCTAAGPCQWGGRFQGPGETGSLTDLLEGVGPVHNWRRGLLGRRGTFFPSDSRQGVIWAQVGCLEAGWRQQFPPEGLNVLDGARRL